MRLIVLGRLKQVESLKRARQDLVISLLCDHSPVSRLDCEMMLRLCNANQGELGIRMLLMLAVKCRQAEVSYLLVDQERMPRSVIEHRIYNGIVKPGQESAAAASLPNGARHKNLSISS